VPSSYRLAFSISYLACVGPPMARYVIPRTYRSGDQRPLQKWCSSLLRASGWLLGTSQSPVLDLLVCVLIDEPTSGADIGKIHHFEQNL
jgi:hypothetical protein